MNTHRVRTAQERESQTANPSLAQDRPPVPWGQQRARVSYQPRKRTQEPSGGRGGGGDHAFTFKHTRYHSTAYMRRTASLFHPLNYAILKF